jgi:chromate transporter
LVLFFFPVWHNLKKYAVIYRSLEGINAAVVGIMTGATFYLIKDNFLFALFNGESIAFVDVFIVLLTFLLLRTNRIPTPYIVMGCLLLGWLTQVSF